MKLVDQHFAECSFCGCKYPPQWQPIMHQGKPYCSMKCVHFSALPLAAESPDRSQALKPSPEVASWLCA